MPFTLRSAVLALTRHGRPASRGVLTSGRTIRACALALAVLACLPGCGKRYLMVDIVYEGVGNLNQKRDVRATADYKDKATSIKSITFRLPDKCLTSTAAQATGTSTSSDVVLISDCAVWLSRLERAVTEKGYRVISFDALNRLERQKQISPYVAARELGADLVFMINSLETGEKKFGQMTDLKLHYYDSDPYGVPTQEVKLDQERRALLKSFVKSSLQQDEDARKDAVASLSATLDATGVVSASGEAIWFYRWGVGKKLQEGVHQSYLFRGRDMTWRPVDVWKKAALHAAPRLESASDEDRVEAHGREAKQDIVQALKFALVEEVAEDFVKNFHAGSR